MKVGNKKEPETITRTIYIPLYNIKKNETNSKKKKTDKHFTHTLYSIENNKSLIYHIVLRFPI